MDLLLLHEHPCLKIYQERKDTFYAGSIIVNAEIYHIKIRENHNCTTSRFEYLDADNSLEKLPGILEQIKYIDTGNISFYVKNLVKIIETYNPPLKNNSSTYLKVLSEFKEFSEFYIDLKMLELSSDLTTIKVSFDDQENREHCVEFGVNFDEPSDIFHFQRYDVPLENSNILKIESSSIKELYNIFLGYIVDLQPFFDFMDMVDAHCVVIDPQEISRKYTYRRVLVESNFSVIISVDPCSMISCPNFAFVGPTNLVDEYQRRVQKNINNWDYTGYFFEQVLLVLGIERFSKKRSTISISQNRNDNILKADSDCSICFLSDFKGNFPDVTCDHQRCGNVYHAECLYEWLSLMEFQRNFSEIKGFCPNCEKSITCPIVNVGI